VNQEDEPTLGEASSRAATVDYEDAETRVLVERWSQDNSLDARQQLIDHLSQLFDVRTLHVSTASIDQTMLIVQVRSDRWPSQREFVPTTDGSLWYDSRP
jgi:hypothetical protein